MSFIGNLEIADLWKTLKTKKDAQEILNNFLPLVYKMDFEKLHGRKQDQLSTSLLPSEFKTWLPLQATGDGNCLFNSISILLAGDESLGGVLRLLTVAELFANSEFYASHPQLTGISTATGYSIDALLHIFISNDKACDHYRGNIESAARAIEVLAQETAKPFIFSSPFHILAVASVVNKPICSVYPDIPLSLRIKKAVSGTFYPREFLTTGPEEAISVMWTRAGPCAIHNWKPNHFVPLVRSTSRVEKHDASHVDLSKSPRKHFSHEKSPVVGTIFSDDEFPTIAESLERAQQSGKSKPKWRCFRKPKETHNLAPPKRELKPPMPRSIATAKKTKGFNPSFKEHSEPVSQPPVVIPNQPASTGKLSELYSRSRVQRKKQKKEKAASKKTPLEMKKPVKPTPTQKTMFAYFKTSDTKKLPDNDTTVKSTADKDEKKEKSTEDLKEEEVLPLQGPGCEWYHEKGVNAAANIKRSEDRYASLIVKKDEEFKVFVPNSATGSLSENIDALMEKLTAAVSLKQQEHFSALIQVAKYMMDNGPIISTQDLARKYKEIKALKASHHIESANLLVMLSKHLNVAQIYIEGRGYVVERNGVEDISKLLQSIEAIDRARSKESIVHDRVREALGDDYKTIISYLDSKRDIDTFKSVLTKITSAKFMAGLAGVQDKRSFQRSKDLVSLNLMLFEDMKKSIEKTEISTLTGEAKRRKQCRLLQKMKLEKLRHVYTGRGRMLKSEEFPDLAGILEFAFGEADRVKRAGGGLESHPRLTDTVLYRAADNNTIMKHARETILALAPEGFKISLSSCFNYTQNYRAGTYQAKRHHAGRGINACLSLHKPPRIGVDHFVINLHWSTHNVNITLDNANVKKSDTMVDSKDAKAKINADVSPVQKPGKTWRRLALPDHDWDRSTNTSVTPMSHLFVETDVIVRDEGNDSFHQVRRTGAAVTLLNLSYFEPETVHRAFNEIFLLMLNPSLDAVFRNPDTGELKKNFIFIVDNGPSEAPSNPLVKMWLVRLAKALKLKTITQKSFAEYHSKRNPVERVHAVQNDALSNEVFSSKSIHSDYEVGDRKHKENMEHMAEEVRKCLLSTQFGGKPCLVLRGIGEDNNYVFNDEEKLVSFIRKSEGQKQLDADYYQISNTDLWDQVATIWNLDYTVHRKYREDYEMLQTDGDKRSCWEDKYSTTIFNPDFHEECDEIRNFQPIPDYIRWFNTGGELHYLPLEKLRELSTSVVDNTPGAFLPSNVLDMAFKVFTNETEDLYASFAFLTWCTVDDVKQYHANFKEKLEKTFLESKEREYWSQDDLYKTKDKQGLQKMCRECGVSPEGKKYECVKRIVEKLERETPPAIEPYNGDMSSIPHSVTDIAKMSVYSLRQILRFHNVLDCGTKDELALRVAMLINGRSDLAFDKELQAITNLVSAIKTLICEQKVLYIADPRVIHTKRKFSTPTAASLSTSRPRDQASVPERKMSSFLPVPTSITLDGLEEMFDQLVQEMLCLNKNKREQDTSVSTRFTLVLASMKCEGTKLLAFWSQKEIGDTGWKTGWYKATVLKYNEENDNIVVEFDKEKGVTYTYSLEKEARANKIKLAKDYGRRIDNYEEIMQVGATVEVHWLKDELQETEWPAGWYSAEVQSIDRDEDEIDIVYFEQECVYTIAVLPNLISGKLRLKEPLF